MLLTSTDAGHTKCYHQHMYTYSHTQAPPETAHRSTGAEVSMVFVQEECRVLACKTTPHGGGASTPCVVGVEWLATVHTQPNSPCCVQPPRCVHGWWVCIKAKTPHPPPCQCTLACKYNHTYNIRSSCGVQEGRQHRQQLLSKRLHGWHSRLSMTQRTAWQLKCNTLGMMCSTPLLRGGGMEMGV